MSYTYLHKPICSILNVYSAYSTDSKMKVISSFSVSLHHEKAVESHKYAKLKKIRCKMKGVEMKEVEISMKIVALSAKIRQI